MHPSTYSMPLSTKPVGAIPASVASSSRGRGSGSSGIPLFTLATFELRPSSLLVSVATSPSPRIAGYRLLSCASKATPLQRNGVISMCMRSLPPISRLDHPGALPRELPAGWAWQADHMGERGFKLLQRRRVHEEGRRGVPGERKGDGFIYRSALFRLNPKFRMQRSMRASLQKVGVSKGLQRGVGAGR